MYTRYIYQITSNNGYTHLSCKQNYVPEYTTMNMGAKTKYRTS